MTLRTFLVLATLSLGAACVAGPADDTKLRDGAGVHDEDLAG